MINFIKSSFFYFLLLLSSSGIARDFISYPYSYSHNPYVYIQEILVTNVWDSGPGTLREAINQANQSPIRTKIGFRINSTKVYISSPLPIINSDCYIDGATFIGLDGMPLPGKIPEYITLEAEGLASKSLPFQITYGDLITYPYINYYTGFLPTSLTVTNTNKSGIGSFYQAIVDANCLTDTKDTIKFNIPGSGPHICQFYLDTEYNRGLREHININSPMIINGGSQPLNGSIISGPQIEISAPINITSSSVRISGLHIHNNSSTLNSNGVQIWSNLNSIIIDNCVITGFKLSGIELFAGNENVYSSNVTIRNNIIGLLPDGITIAGNGNGLTIGGRNITIKDNVISGNTNYGITTGFARFNQFVIYKPIIEGNKIGTDIYGTLRKGNGSGIYLENPDSAIVGGDQISQRNIISGNIGDAIIIKTNLSSPSGTLPSLHKIKGNFIGTDVSETNPIPNEKGITNTGNGFLFEIENNTIAYNTTYGIHSSLKSLIKNNSIFNNSKAIEETNPLPEILIRSTTQITGKTLPNNLVQLFYDDGPNQTSQGKSFIAEVTSDNNGNFSYNGPIISPCEVVALATNIVNRSSTGFSTLQYSLGPDKVACTSDIVTLDAGPGSSYLWSTGETTQTITVSSSGNYSVELENGCTMKDTIKVSFYSAPQVNLGKDTSICQGQSIIIDAGNAGASYVWNNNTYNSSKTITVYNTRKLWVDVNYGTCKASDTINIKFTPNIYAYLGADQVVCTEAKVPLDAGNSGASFLWSSGKTTQKDTINQPGKHWVRISNECFVKSDTILISNVSLNVNLGKDTTLCSGQNLLLDAGNSGSMYNWNNNIGLNTQTLNITSAGTYIAKVSQGNCTKSDTISINYSSPINLNLGSDTVICNTAPFTLNAQNIGATYLWSTGANTPTISASSDDKYWVKVSQSAHCYKTDTIRIDFTNCEKISGKVFNDVNNNCIFDAIGDKIVEKSLVILKNNDLGKTYYSLTDANGNYAIQLPLGNYQVSLSPNIFTTVICPASGRYDINLNGNNPVLNKDFGIKYNLVNDLGINISTTSERLRLGTELEYIITYQNKGNIDIVNGKVKLLLDKNMTFVSTDKPGHSLSGDTLIWNIHNFASGELATIRIKAAVPINTSLIGLSICSNASISSNIIDVNIINNTSKACSILSYPFDPNNKLVTPLGTTAEGFISMKDTVLTYKINFQNTGNDTAYTVVIRDTLSDKLNVASIEMLGSSHPYTYNIYGTGIIKWEFKNIMLPDSNINEPGSHGFITFRIKLKSGLPVGTVITNQVGIYFDLAPPVLTNIAKNTLSNSIAEQDINFPPIANVTYATGGVKLKASATSGLDLVYAYTGPITLDGDSLIITGPGEVRVRAYQEGNENFEPADFVDRNFTISKATQIISINHIGSKLVNDSPFKISSTGGKSGNPIIFTIVSGPATINGDEITIVGIGQVTIAATQEGNNNYEAANEVTSTFEVLDVTGVKDITSANYIFVYPNPCKNAITIDLSAYEIHLQAVVHVLTLEGKEVKSFILSNTIHKESNIDLNKGIYILKISIGNNDIYKKLMVE